MGITNFKAHQKSPHIVNCRQHNLVKIWIFTILAESKLAFRAATR